MNELWIQIVGGLVTVIAGAFGLIKYNSSQNAKRETALLEHTQETQRLMLDYFEKKNGHMERMADKFTATSKELATAVNNLSTKIEVMDAKKSK